MTSCGAVDSTLLFHVLSVNFYRRLNVVIFRDEVLVLHRPVSLLCQFDMLTLVQSRRKTILSGSNLLAHNFR